LWGFAIGVLAFFISQISFAGIISPSGKTNDMRNAAVLAIFSVTTSLHIMLIIWGRHYDLIWSVPFILSYFSFFIGAALVN
jgi:uncharacterized membrane protein YhhN